MTAAETGTARTRPPRTRPVATISEVGALTRAELVDAGRALRRRVPRSSHAELDLPADRPDPIDLLEASNRGRLPDLVPVRYARMLESDFAFLRGSPVVMTWDLARTPLTGINVQACGDAHLLNFGAYAAPDRRLTFDVNDFDETLPAPWEWDVKRLAASCAVAARVVGRVDADASAARAAALGYAAEMGRLVQLSTLEIHYAHTDVDLAVLKATDPADASELRALAASSRSHTTEQAFTKLTRDVDGRRRIVERPPLIVRFDQGSPFEDQIDEFYRQYRESLSDDRRRLVDQYHFRDVAQKVVGVGSVGTRCAVILFEGRGALDPLFLQMKEAGESVLEPYVGGSEYEHSGQRVVVGQRTMQALSDIFLGWSHSDGSDFYVRQLRDMKGSVDLLRMRSSSLVGYAALCGRTLARAHARSVGPGFISGYLGRGRTFADAIARFATAYADQTARDYELLRTAVASGRVAAAR
jgi:uncharacterized protein (DUF2252 family)